MIIVKKDKKKCESPVIIQGEPGPAGEAATIAIGQVETLAAGEEAYVTNVGDETEAVLNFGIPKGPGGVNGSDGENGTLPITVNAVNQADKTMAEVVAAVQAGRTPVIYIYAGIIRVGMRDYLINEAQMKYQGLNEDGSAEFTYEDTRFRYTATMDTAGHVTFDATVPVKQGDLTAIRQDMLNIQQGAASYTDEKTAAEATARSNADSQLADGISAIEEDLADTKTEMEEALQGIRSQIPEELPNPFTLTFTGAVNAEYDGRSNVNVNIPTGGEGGSGRDTKIIEFTVSGGAYSTAYAASAIEAMAASMNILGHVASEDKWFTYAGMNSYGTHAMFSRLTAAEEGSDYQCMAEYLLVDGSKTVSQVFKEIGGGGGGEAELLTVTGTLEETTSAGIRIYTTDKTWQEIDDANAAGMLVVLRTESEVIPMTRQVGAIIYFEGLNLEHPNAPGLTRAFIARARPSTANIQPLEMHPTVDATEVTYGDSNVAAALGELNENSVNHAERISVLETALLGVDTALNALDEVIGL